MVVSVPLGCDFSGSLLNPRQKSFAHLDQMARKYADKEFGGQYLMAHGASHIINLGIGLYWASVHKHAKTLNEATVALAKEVWIITELFMA